MSNPFAVDPATANSHAFAVDRPIGIVERLAATVTGSGPHTIVLANGFCTSAQSWSALLPHLPANARIVRFEYVGNPGTPAGAWNPGRYAELYGHADDVVLLLRELGVRHATFIGHSMSAMVGALAHVAAPELIGRLIMLGASPRYIDDGEYVGGFPLDVVNALIASVEQGLEQWIAGFAPISLGVEAAPEHLRDYVAHFLSMRPDVARLMLTSIFRSDFRYVLPRVHCPVDVVQSAKDNAVPLAVAQYLTHQLPQATLHVLPVVGHVPHLTHSAVVAPFLQQLLGQV